MTQSSLPLSSASSSSSIREKPSSPCFCSTTQAEFAPSFAPTALLTRPLLVPSAPREQQVLQALRLSSSLNLQRRSTNAKTPLLGCWICTASAQCLCSGSRFRFAYEIIAEILQRFSLQMEIDFRF